MHRRTRSAARSQRRSSSGSPGRSRLRARSSGLLDLGSKPPPRDAVEAAADLGLDISRHRSRRLEPGSLRDCDAVVGFEPVHVATAVLEGGAPTERVLSPARARGAARAGGRSRGATSPWNARGWRWRERTNGAARFAAAYDRVRRSPTRSAAVAAPTAAPFASSASSCRGSWTGSSGRGRAAIVAASERSPLRIVLVAEEVRRDPRVCAPWTRRSTPSSPSSPSDAVPDQESVAALARRLGLPVQPARLVTSPAFADALRRERRRPPAERPLAPARRARGAGSAGHRQLQSPPWAAAAATRASTSRAGRSTTARPATARTLHWMTPEVDGGPIAYSAEFDVDPLETAISLYLKCVRHGVPLVTRLVEAAASGGADAIPALAQDRAARRYFGRRPPHDRWLLWELEAERLAALVRACDYGPFDSPWGRARTVVGEVEVEVLRATTGGPSRQRPSRGRSASDVDGGVLVAAGDRWLLDRSRRGGRTPARSGDGAASWRAVFADRSVTVDAGRLETKV